MADPKHKFNEDVENHINRQIVDEEYTISKSAKTGEDIEFEAILDKLECKRTEKDYEWMSDIAIPELASIVHTEASDWASEYFPSRDFVEVKLEGTAEQDKQKCRAAKKCLNSTLNRRGLYHYHKYIRARLINALRGNVCAIGWWEQKIVPKQIGTKDVEEPLGVDIYGNTITSEDQEPATRVSQEPVMGEEVIYDHFNYEIIDPRNIFTDGKYSYSLNDKHWVIIRLEKTYEDLEKDANKNGYFNLEFVKELTKVSHKTDTSRETYNKGELNKEGNKPVSKNFDVLLRLGKLPCVVKKRNEEGYPSDIVPGYAQDGTILDKAELIDTITETVYTGSQRILIRFQPLPFRTSKGVPYKPAIRGWCYIHPTKDIGLSDGKYLREIQIGIDDSFNMGMDRVKLATLPTLKGNRNALTDNDTIYFAPEHVMEMDNPDLDLKEFKIDDNIQGTIMIQNMLTNKGQQCVSVYPTTMGQLPAPSTTATASAGAEARGNVRSKYKSLTFEHTFLAEFYYMILQMTYQFARAETATKMMGDDAQYFDPDADYSYTPLSSNIELEYNKHKKVQLYDQTLGRLAGLVKILPQLVPVLAHIISRQLVLQGDEYQDIGEMIEKLAGSKPQAEPQAGETPSNMQSVPTSNQSGIEMSGAEQSVRGMPTGGI